MAYLKRTFSPKIISLSLHYVRCSPALDMMAKGVSLPGPGRRTTRFHYKVYSEYGFHVGIGALLGFIGVFMEVLIALCLI